MKKPFKIILIIAIALMILGVGISISAFVVSGFDFSKFAIDESDLVAYEMHIPAEEGSSAVETLVFGDMEGLTAWHDISVVPSADEGIHITMKGMPDESLGYNFSDNGKTIALYAERPSRRIFSGIGIFDFSGAVPMTIAIPETVKNLDFRCDAGNLFIEDMAIAGNINYYGDASDVTLTRLQVGGALNLVSDASTMELTDVTANYINAETDAGYLYFDRIAANEIDVEIDFADFEFYSLDVTKALRIFSDVGNIAGTLCGSAEDFTIYRTVEFGNDNLPNGGNGAKLLEVRCDTGNVHITFLGDMGIGETAPAEETPKSEETPNIKDAPTSKHHPDKNHF